VLDKLPHVHGARTEYERMRVEMLELHSPCCNYSITLCQHIISHLLHS